MSDTYEQYAKDTYNTVFRNMEAALRGAGGKPVLVVSGEAHEDGWGEWISDIFTSAEKEEPALAAAYTHIAAIKAAEKLVGKENVLISIELPAEGLKKAQELMDQGALPEWVNLPRSTPMGNAFTYAYLNNFEMVGDDAGRTPIRRLFGDSPFENTDDLRENIEGNARYEAERGAIAAHAKEAKIVVHLGGAAHIPMLYGHRPTDDLTNANLPRPNNEVNPLAAPGPYGRVVFFNSADAGGDLASAFFTSTRNAIQLDAPGQMDSSDKGDNIAKRIEAAADATAATPPGRTVTVPPPVVRSGQ